MCQQKAIHGPAVYPAALSFSAKRLPPPKYLVYNRDCDRRSRGVLDGGESREGHEDRGLGDRGRGDRRSRECVR
jgi:hypothetical protein